MCARTFSDDELVRMLDTDPQDAGLYDELVQRIVSGRWGESARDEQIEELNDQIARLEKERDEARLERDELEEERDEARLERDELEVEVADLRREVESLEGELAEARQGDLIEEATP